MAVPIDRRFAASLRRLWIAVQQPLLALSVGAYATVPFTASTADARLGDSWIVGSGGLLPAACLCLAVSLIVWGLLRAVGWTLDRRIAPVAFVFALVAGAYSVSYAGARIHGATEANIATVRRVVDAVPINECKNPAWTRIGVVQASVDRIELKCDSWSRLPFFLHRGALFVVRCVDGRWQGDPLPGDGFGQDFKWEGPACAVPQQ